MARQYVRLAVALGERDPDSLDFYAGPADLVDDIRRSPPPLSAIRRDASVLAGRIENDFPADRGVDRARVRRLLVDVRALVARVDLLTGTRLPYDRESETFFGLKPPLPDRKRMADIRARVAAIVGQGGRLVDRYSNFAGRFTIGRERLSAVMEAALSECRNRTRARLPLPPSEGVTIEFVHDRPWSAFSRYRGAGQSVIQINTDFRFTADQALQLACHEGYPGHHTRNVLLESTPREAARWPERLVQLTFSRSSLVSEAASMAAIDVAFSPEERTRIVRERLCPLAAIDPTGTEQHVAVERLLTDLQEVQADVARRYIDGEVEFARAVSRLEEEALVPHAESMIKYVNEFRSYVTTYTAGRAEFAARLAKCGGANATEEIRWRCFRDAIVKPEI